MKRGLLICLLMFCALMGMDVAAKTDIVVASFNIRYHYCPVKVDK